MTYLEAHAEAMAKADATGFDYGIERNRYYPGGFAPPFLLPKACNRYGHELRCEVVYCMIESKIQPGHGPNAGRPNGSGWQP